MNRKWHKESFMKLANRWLWPLLLGLGFLSFFLPEKTTYADTILPTDLKPEEAFRRGVEQYIERHFSDAENLFRVCVQAEPKNSEYLCWLAQSTAFTLAERAMRGASNLTLLPEGKAIRNLYTQAIENDPKSERARVGYAVLLRDIPGWLGGNPEKAVAMLQEVLKENPKNIFAMHNLGTYYINQAKDYQRGVEYLDRAVQESQKRTLTPEEQMKLANTYHALGVTYRDHLDSAEKAAQSFEKSLEINPDSVVTLLDLVKTYRQIGRLEPARESLRKAATIIKENRYKRYQRDLTLEAKKLKMGNELGAG